MKLISHGSNCSEVVFTNGSILFSYETPVAISLSVPVADYPNLNPGVYRTSEKFSKTTSKHINLWTSTTRFLSQEDIEKLANAIAAAN